MPPRSKNKEFKANTYQFPDFAQDFIVTDIYKMQWIIGNVIKKNNSSLICLATKASNNEQFVMKIEPLQNGSLFRETHFYRNCAKKYDLKNYVDTKSLKHLSVPMYGSSGQFKYKTGENSNFVEEMYKEFRFLVLNRFQSDFQAILDKQPNQIHNEVGVLCLMRQIVQSLEYIHSCGYVHGDIKGSNVMLHNNHESYLVDYGFNVKFMCDNVHQKYETNIKRKLNGTVEYKSREAHKGALISRKCDLEILAYCVIHWLSGSLPWINLINKPEKVLDSKIKHMKDVQTFINVTLGSVSSVSDSVKLMIQIYLNEINKLKFESELPYSEILVQIKDTLNQLGYSDSVDNFYAFNQIQSSTAISSLNTQVLNFNVHNIDEPRLINIQENQSADTQDYAASPVFVSSNNEDASSNDLINDLNNIRLNQTRLPFKLKNNQIILKRRKKSSDDNGSVTSCKPKWVKYF